MCWRGRQCRLPLATQEARCHANLQWNTGQDGGWFVGCLTEVPGVFSQGETLETPIENIRDAYRMMLDTDRDARVDARRTEITGLKRRELIRR